MTEALSTIISRELIKRNNPIDLKPALIGQIAALEPICVSVEDSQILHTEGDNLYISQWFRFRCDIDKTKVLSSDIPDFLDDAASIKEVHSANGSACSMPSAVNYLINAINGINSELLKLKCDLKIGDLVWLQSMESNNGYLLVDKVL